MANQPFDTTIINPLERPKSSDINAAQSEIHRDLRDYLFRAYAMSDGADVVTATAQTGFVGRGFVVEPTSPASMDLTIAQGIGFQATNDTTSAVGGVVGLNDLSYYKPLLLSGSHVVTVPTAPVAVFCRRDLIEVRYNRALTDATLSDVYSTASGVFTSQTINKTMTFDLVNDAVQYIPAGSATAPTASIVYRSGVLVAHDTDADFLNAPIPSTDSGYVAIAVVNVGPSLTAVTAGHIADWRPLLSADKRFEVVGSATLGGGNITTAPYSSPTITNLNLRAPAGVRACLSHPVAVGGAQNEYTLTVVGLPNTANITGFFTTANILSQSNSETFGFPLSVATLSRSTNVIVDADSRIKFLDSAQTSPPISVAVGQPVQQIQFALGYHALDSSNTAVQFVTGDANYTNGSPLGQDTIDVCFDIKVAV
jgi:hypothetical protein